MFVIHKTHVIIALYVDDLLIFAMTMTPINGVKNLSNKEYKTNDLGRAEYILGIKIKGMTIPVQLRMASNG